MLPAVALIIKCDYHKSVTTKKCENWTDTHTDGQTSGKVIAKSRSAKHRQQNKSVQPKA